MIVNHNENDENHENHETHNKSYVDTPATPFTPGTPGLFHTPPKSLPAIDRSALRAQLASLPAPQNEYEASLPEEDEDDDLNEEGLGDGQRAAYRKAMETEDAEEVERRIREEEEALEREELARRSEVLKRELPRGSGIPARFMVGAEGATALLREEMNAIMRYEDFRYPVGEGGGKYTQEITLPVISREERLAAEMLILEEAGDLESAVAQRTPTQMEEEYWTVWNQLQSDFVYDPSSKSVVHLNELSEVCNDDDQ